MLRKLIRRSVSKSTIHSLHSFSGFNFNHIVRDSTYDYIIAGAGCAGLSLAVQIAGSPSLRNKKILLIDKASKNANDRTWCYWEKDPGFFDDILFRKWNRVWFHGDGIASLLDISPYSYKMIRGIDFYNYCFQILKDHPGFNMLYEEIKAVSNEGGMTFVKTEHNLYKAEFVFNSVPFQQPEKKAGTYHLLQHFKGWIVETPGPVFNTREATLMDFRTPQHQGTTFLYTMPFSSTQALVEYTLFSESVLTDEEYDTGLRTYLSERLGISQYSILETEKGIIPMTNHRFREKEGRIFHIGTAGGQTKPSTGYTFRNIQMQVSEIIKSLEKSGRPDAGIKKTASRFHWYDSILLNILSNRKLEGKYIFSELFKKNNPTKILRFLDNATTMREEFSLLRSLPQWPFLKAGIEELVKK